LGIEVSDDISDCDVLFESSCRFNNLISLIFFHYDKRATLQQTITTGNFEKNIDLYDHETIVNAMTVG
jgi:hypothetical protein